jgi:hypothetical protein
MNPALQGLLIGLGLGLFFIIFEYLALSKLVNERAKKLNRKAEFDVTEKRRMSTITRFAAILPLAFAFGFWWIWG